MPNALSADQVVAFTLLSGSRVMTEALVLNPTEPSAHNIVLIYWQSDESPVAVTSSRVTESEYEVALRIALTNSQQEGSR